jgi:hypothetical protein
VLDHFELGVTVENVCSQCGVGAVIDVSRTSRVAWQVGSDEQDARIGWRGTHHDPNLFRGPITRSAHFTNGCGCMLIASQIHDEPPLRIDRIKATDIAARRFD